MPGIPCASDACFRSAVNGRESAPSSWTTRRGMIAMPRTAMNLIDPAVRRCIDQCVRCHEVCLSTIPYCLEQGNQHATEAHITLLIHYATICQLSPDFTLPGSDDHT